MGNPGSVHSLHVPRVPMGSASSDTALCCLIINLAGRAVQAARITSPVYPVRL